jgi:NADPH:quinone reductase-like Zn-dependent oxidoreductase
MSDRRLRTLDEAKPIMRTPMRRRARQSDDGLHVQRSALAGSVTLVTGGSRGIGRLVDQALADAGIAVGLVARSEHELAAAGQLVRLRHQHAPTAAADPAYRRALSQQETIRRTYDPWSLRVTASDLQYDNVRRAER